MIVQYSIHSIQYTVFDTVHIEISYYDLSNSSQLNCTCSLTLFEFIICMYIHNIHVWFVVVHKISDQHIDETFDYRNPIICIIQVLPYSPTVLWLCQYIYIYIWQANRYYVQLWTLINSNNDNNNDNNNNNNTRRKKN